MENFKKTLTLTKINLKKVQKLLKRARTNASQGSKQFMVLNK